MEKKRPLKDRILDVLDFSFKFFLVVLSVIDLFGFLPSSLDIATKFLTGALLFYFWDKFNITKFMFGKSIEWLDKTILASFYILVIDTYIRLIQTLDLTSSIVVKTNALIGHLPSFMADGIRHSFMFIYDINNNPLISLLSAYIGFVALIVLVLYLTIFVSYGEKSVFHSVIFMFARKRVSDFSKNYSERKERKLQRAKFLGLKLIISLAIVLAISQYFFNLLNQWLILSLGKSLFIVGLLYVVKDIKGSKSEWLNRLGNLDDKMMSLITEIFTTPGKFYLGFAFLLAVHYLSDLSLFFIPFFLRNVPVEPYYIDRLPGLHTPVPDLISAELAKFSASTAAIYSVYIISAIGVIILIAIPMIFLLLEILNQKFEKAITTKGYYILLMISFISISVFVMGPWVSSVSLYGQGITGIDFVTNMISDSPIPITVIFISAVVAFVLASMLFMRVEDYSRKISNYMLLIVFLAGLFYFGKYVFDFFISSLFYHISLMKFFAHSSPFLCIMFLFLLVLEILFYIFGFFAMAYVMSRYIIREIIHELLNDVAIYAWTIVIFLVPASVLFFSPESILAALLVILVFFIFTYAMKIQLSGKEKRDDYLLGVALAIFAYEIVGLFSFFFGKNLPLLANYGITISETTAYTIAAFLSPIIIAFVTVDLLSYFGFSIRENISIRMEPVNLLVAVVAGVLFGFLFYIINEPNAIFVVSFFSNKWMIFTLVFLALLVAVSEELLFRGLLLNLAKNPFSIKAALVLQALVFALIHFANAPRMIWNYFSGANINLINAPFAPFSVPVFFFVYFVVLFGFAYYNGLVANRTKNLVYPILTHWIANTLLFIMVLLM